jgi:hypothetical protein
LPRLALTDSFFVYIFPPHFGGAFAARAAVDSGAAEVLQTVVLKTVVLRVRTAHE